MEFFEIIRYIGIALIVFGIVLYLSSKGKLSSPVFGNQASQKNNNAGGFTLDITKQAQEGKVDPVIGREEEILRVTQILTRRRKNNVILVGEPGVGKTAIVEGLALKIATGDVPNVLKNKQVLVLQVADLIGGTKYRGEFEQRVKQLVERVTHANRQIILFIDEIHTIMQTKGAEGSVNISDILKPALARGELQVIGATTKKEYEQYILPDESWERRFQSVLVDEPSVAESVEILKGLKKNYELYHKVVFTDDAITSAVRLSQEYITGRKLPDKAIDIMDESAAMVNVRLDAEHDHATALLYGAANSLAQEHNLETPEIKKLKEELLLLRKEELQQKDAKKLSAVQKQKISKVKEIQKQESTILQKNGWPQVTDKHIRQVVAEWVGMKEKDIH
ncbi:MAG: ATP-dependent Clp protease ATP-binding subunit [Candidatus Magasanikbacteria bacterium]|nr:ATP-dependent Clp protease ATP-binding subunit [Candidatus Magasanikbacteria bacterium]